MWPKPMHPNVTLMSPSNELLLCSHWLVLRLPRRRPSSSAASVSLRCSLSALMSLSLRPLNSLSSTYTSLQRSPSASFSCRHRQHLLLQTINHSWPNVNLKLIQFDLFAIRLDACVKKVNGVLNLMQNLYLSQSLDLFPETADLLVKILHLTLLHFQQHLHMDVSVSIDNTKPFPISDTSIHSFLTSNYSRIDILFNLSYQQCKKAKGRLK